VGVDDLDGVVARGLGGGGAALVPAGLDEGLQRSTAFLGFDHGGGGRFVGQAQRLLVLTQGHGRVSAAMLEIFGRALRHDLTARVTAFGAEFDQPVAGADHVEVVLDQDDAVARVQQLAEGAHQLGDVVEVQAGGGLVEHEQRAFACRALAALAQLRGGLDQVAGELEALSLAA